MSRTIRKVPLWVKSARPEDFVSIEAYRKCKRGDYSHSYVGVVHRSRDGWRDTNSPKGKVVAKKSVRRLERRIDKVVIAENVNIKADDDHLDYLEMCDIFDQEDHYYDEDVEAERDDYGSYDYEEDYYYYDYGEG
jgi:hypothetical protein